ncbi:hypothetical protein [Paucimonas lemoignei]|nr:hypothetical protein [Paucimonas lemoignei]
MTLAHKHDSAWDMGDFAYDLGDTMENGKAKAASLGIHPCSDEYAAFITAFSRRVRLKQVSPLKVAANAGAIEQAQGDAEANGAPDMLRAVL